MSCATPTEFSSLPKVFLEIEIDQQPAGKIEVSLFSDKCPLTAENFTKLCTGEKGFGYKGTIFHRIVPNYMAQGGDFTHHNGTGGHSVFENYGDDKKFPDENFIYQFDQELLVGMANDGRNTNGSQFFITMTACPWLNGKHVAFGKVTAGAEVVRQIEACGSDPSGFCVKRVTVSGCGEI